MDTFIGVKMIQAEPQERDGKPGYKVVYEDGYTSWSPKAAFEAAYLKLSSPSKITPDVVDVMLGKVEGSQIDPKTTLVRAIAPTGFVSYEASSCVDPANYDNELGTKIGAERIKNKLWGHLGFILQWAQNGLKSGEE